MALVSKFTDNERLIRKRLAARMRQRRCRERKREAMVAQRKGEHDSPKSDATLSPEKVVETPATIPMAAVPVNDGSPHESLPRTVAFPSMAYPPHPHHHHVPPPPPLHHRHQTPAFMMRYPPVHYEHHPRMMAAPMPFHHPHHQHSRYPGVLGAAPRMVSVPQQQPPPPCVMPVSSASTTSSTCSSVSFGNQKKPKVVKRASPVPTKRLASREMAAIDAMLSLRCTSDEETASTVSDHSGLSSDESCPVPKTVSTTFAAV